MRADFSGSRFLSRSLALSLSLSLLIPISSQWYESNQDDYVLYLYLGDLKRSYIADAVSSPDSPCFWCNGTTAIPFQNMLQGYENRGAVTLAGTQVSSLSLSSS